MDAAAIAVLAGCFTGILLVAGLYKIVRIIEHIHMRDRIVEAGIEGDEVVIRVGINYIANMAPEIKELQEDDEIGMVNVVNAEQLAADVVKELLEEAEDGTNAIHLLLEQAIIKAAENGTEGLCEFLS